jgi:hypothetical protein
MTVGVDGTGHSQARRKLAAPILCERGPGAMTSTSRCTYGFGFALGESGPSAPEHADRILGELAEQLTKPTTWPEQRIALPPSGVPVVIQGPEPL